MTRRAAVRHEGRLYGEVGLHDVSVSTGLTGGPLTHIEGRAVPFDNGAMSGGIWNQCNAGPSTSRPPKGRRACRCCCGMTVIPGLSGCRRAGKVAATGCTASGHSTAARRRSGPAPGEVWRARVYVDRVSTHSVGMVTGRRMGPPTCGPDYMDRCTRVEARLLEVSLVPTPVFADAQVSLVRSAERRRGSGGDPTPHLSAWKRTLTELER